jgi:P pilus assembly chaperone PapD
VSKDKTSESAEGKNSGTTSGEATAAGPATKARKAAPRPRPKRNGRGIMGGVLSAAVLLAGGAGVVAGAAVLPASAGSRPVETPLTDVPAGRSTMVCPGPAVLPEGTAAGTDAEFSPVSRTAKNVLDAVVLSDASGLLPGSKVAALNGSGSKTVSQAPAGTPAPATGAPVLKAAAASQASGGIAVVTAEPTGQQQAAVAAVGSYTATDGDLRGLAAAQCQQPSNDLWLLGADTTVGRTALLNLSNPSGTPATVNLELLGSKGRIQSPGSRGLLVPPGSSRTINLAGLAPDEESLSLHVRSSGGPVAATVQQSVLRGLISGGVEHLAPGVGPADTQVMTGVVIQDPKTFSTLGSKSGFSDATPALEVTVPGAADAVVDIKLFGENGQRALPGGGAVTVKAGTVAEIPLSSVPAGTYTVSITSDVPFAAASRMVWKPRESAPMDFAWSPASVRLGGQHVVALPKGADRYLSFGVPDGRATVTYTPVTADGKLGKAQSVDIAGGTTTVIGVPDEAAAPGVTGYVVAASGDPAYGALLLAEAEGGPGISTVAVQQGAQGHEKLAVTLGY